MIKHYVFTALAMMCCGSGMAQMNQMFFIEEFERTQYDEYAMPRLRVYDDVVYVPGVSGLYCRSISDTDGAVAQYFKGAKVIDAVRSGNSIVAAVKDREGEKDSLLLKYDVENEEYTNLTSSLPEGFGESIICLEQNPKNPNSLVAVSLYGVFSSDDFGSSWTARLTDKLNDLSMGHFETHPYADDVSFMYGEAFSQSGFITRISDDWTSAETSVVAGGDGNVYDLAFHPGNPDVIIYSGWHIGKSVDGGKTWTQKSDDLYCGRVFFDEADPDHVFAVGGMFSRVEPLCIYSSDDMGETWSLLSSVEYYDDESKAGIVDVAKYGNKLLVYTLHYGIQELDLGKVASIGQAGMDDAQFEAYFDQNTGRLVFRSSETVGDVEIFDMSGRLVFRGESDNSSGSMSLVNLGTGTYVARFHIADGCVDRKIFIGGGAK